MLLALLPLPLIKLSIMFDLPSESVGYPISPLTLIKEVALVNPAADSVGQPGLVYLPVVYLIGAVHVLL